jgi:type IV pilus assembly protein PilB
MSERKSIGQILKDLGRLDENDIERALDHQRMHGGLFGEALIKLGLIEPDELEWSLANQFDLPFIFPEAGAVDPEAAGMVSMEWALRHNALPIMRENECLTLLIDSPLNIDAPTELSRQTGCQVELALATTSAIRRVIREIFWRRRSRHMGLAQAGAVTMERFLELASPESGRSWGISGRPDRVIGWFGDGDDQRRMRLSGNWREPLDRLLDPPPSEYLEKHGQHTWTARVLNQTISVGLAAIVTPDAVELSVTGDRRADDADGRFPSEDLISELRQTLSDGVMVVGVEQPEDVWTARVLTEIVASMLPIGHRAAYVAMEDAPQDLGLPVMNLEMLKNQPEQVRRFAFDVLILERVGSGDAVLDNALSLAPVILVGLGEASGTERVPEEIDALLSWSGAEAGSGSWSLRLRRELPEKRQR